MTTEKMTVHKALSELKILDDRIHLAISEAVFCVANKHSNEKINGIKVDEYLNMMTGSYDKVVDLMARRNAIKTAVVLSNAKTKVTITGIEYTVAEAIDMKNNFMDLKEELLRKMKHQFNNAQAVIKTRNGDELEKKADQYVIGLYGAKDGKVNAEAFDRTRNDFITAQSYDLLDPIKVNDKINALEEEISNFKSEVDAALSVSNAITEIEINY